jgi:hypothetical protein
MEAELNGYRKAAIVSAFIDHCLLVNANNWVQDQDFLDIPNLRAMWESWWGTRRASWKSEAMTAAQGTGGGQNTAGNKQGAANNKKKPGNSNNKQGGGGGQQQQSNNRQQNGGFAGWQGGGGGQGPSGRQQGQAAFSGPPNEKNICRRFNEKTCSNHWSACSITTKFGPLKLYHLCNFLKRDNGKQELCLEKHARADYHK